MCVKAWKLHHSNNQMCKDTWIPKARQTAAAFVLDKVLLTFQWSPSNWEDCFWDNQRGGKCYSLGDGKRPWPFKARAASSLAPAWALRASVPPARVTAQRQICGKAWALHPPKKASPQAEAPQHPRASHGQPSEETKLAPSSFGKRCWSGTSETLSQLSKGFFLPYRGKLSVLMHSQPDVKGLQPLV